MENFKLTFPSPGWAQVSWPPGGIAAADLKLIESLEVIPGIKIDPTAVSIPRNARPVSGIEDVFRLAGADYAVPTPRKLGVVAVAKRLLYPHQISAAERGYQRGGLFLCDEMGLGKSASAIFAAMGQLGDIGYGSGLIIGPRFTRAHWKRELLAMGAINDESEFCALETRDHNREFNKYARWYFIHYDVVRAWKDRLYQLGPRSRPHVAIVDEAHWIKNGRAVRSKATQLVVGTVPFRILLTGTPMENRPAELWSPLQVLSGPGSWGSPSSFRMRYCGAVRETYGLVDMGPTHTDELRARLAEAGYMRRTVDEVGINLPKLTRKTIEVPLLDIDAREHEQVLYGQDLRSLTRAIIEGRAGDGTIELLSRLRKITSHSKRPHTLEYVWSVLEQGESVVLFSWTRETTEWFAKTVSAHKDRHTEEAPVYVVHGGVSQDKRDGIIDAFQAKGGLLCATLDSLKEGVTLHRARTVVMHDLDWVPSKILQGEKRIHRIGQSRACQSVWMVAEDSIDRVLAKILIGKSEAIAESIGIDASAQAMDELDLANVMGLDSFEDDMRAMVARWRQR